MSSLAVGFPDWQRITQWFGSPVDQATAFPIGAGAKVVGPLNVRNFASIVVCVAPHGGNVTVTVDQQVPGGPAALKVSSTFVVNAGNSVFESFVLLAGVATVTMQGTAGGETLDYAIVPSNTNVNAEVAALTQLGFQHNDGLVANENAIDLEDAPELVWTMVDDPANLRVKVTPTVKQPVQKAGVAIGTRKALDFEDGAGVTFAVTDDAANDRVKVSATAQKVTTSLLSGGPPAGPADGDIWIATAVDTGNAATTNGTRWQLQYNAASGSANKWEWIGGSPLTFDTGNVNTVITAATQVGATGWYYVQNGMSYLTTRPGSWRVWAEVDFYFNGDPGAMVHLDTFAGAALTGNNSINMNNGLPTQTDETVSVEWMIPNVPTGTRIGVAGLVPGGPNYKFGPVYFAVQPIRLG